MTDGGTVRGSLERFGHAVEQQADSASALVEMITRHRESERAGKTATAYQDAHAELTSRGGTEASNAPGVCSEVPGAQPAGYNDRRREEAAPATGRQAPAAAADALLAVLAIDQEQWAKLLADLPLDSLTELLGHAFRLYQRIALEETNRRFEQGPVRPPETPRATTET